MRDLMKKGFAIFLACILTVPIVLAQKSAFPAGRIESPVRAVGFDEAHWGKMARSKTGGFFTAKENVLKQRGSNTIKAPWKAKVTPEFRGIQIYADSWNITGPKPYGVYEYTTTEPAIADPLFLEEIMYFNGGAVQADGTIFGTYVLTNSDGYITMLIHLKYNADTYELEGSIVREWDGNTPLNISGIATDMVYDRVSGNIYGCFRGKTQTAKQQYYFGTLNTGKMTSTSIKEVLDPYYGIAINPSGQLYAITKKGDFGKINKKTGTFTLIKKTGLHTERITSAAIDPVSGLFYYIVCYENGNSELYAIDCATGEANLAYIMPDDQEVVGMWFPDYKAEATAPERPVIKNVEFAGQSLTGTVSLATPSLLFDESSAPKDEKLSYEIYANGKKVQSGSGLQYGQTYKVSVTLEESGMYEFHAVVFNENGASPESKSIYKWVGIDTPAPPADVTASYANGSMTISWDKVTTGQHDGGVGDVKYSIRSAIDNKLIATDISDTSYTFALEAPVALTVYQYNITASSDGLVSEPSTSNIVSLGAFIPPYHETWATPDDVALWTRIDGDADDKGWVVTTLEDGQVAGAWCLSHSYPITEPNNDWLITPSIYLEKGKVYTLNFNLMTGNYSGANIQICAGTSPTIDGMTQVIMPAQKVVYNNWTPVEVNFTSEMTGNCYIGVQCCSGQWMSTLFFNDFTISAPHNPGAPSAATDLKVEVPYDGESKGTLSFISPSTSIDGNELSSLTKIEVLVNNEKIYENDSPVIGKEESIVYDAKKSGQYEFSIICYNDEGEGERARTNAFLGINYPAPPSNANIVETSPGIVDISWDATTKDIAGNDLNPDLVTYDIYGYATNGELELKLGNIEGTSLSDYRAVPAGYQGFVKFFIVARTEAGSTLEPYNGLIGFAGAPTNQIACGTPFSEPYSITFANGQINTLLAINDSEGWGATWGVYTSSDLGFVSRNNDNGYLALNGSYGEQAIYTGKISISEANSVLNYWYLGRDRDQQMEIYVIENGVRQYVQSVTMNAPSGEWSLASVDMSAYEGKVVQLYLNGKLSWGGPSLVVDDFYVGVPIKQDLAALSINAPATVSTETDFNIEYTIKNWGVETATGYTVSLYADGDLVETMENLPDLAPGQTYSGNFSSKAYSLFEEGIYKFSYVVNVPGDSDATNNGSQTVTIKVLNTDYPTVPLTGEVENENPEAKVILSWETPAIIISDFDVVESFESEAYPSWTIDNFGPWTLSNYNTSSTYGLTNYIDYPNRCKPQGFTLFDYNYFVENGFYDEWDAFTPYEGDRYMVAFAHTNGANDAWLISNNLGGMAQQVKFYARSCDSSRQDAETMEVYYSTTGMDKADFIKLEIEGYDSTVPFEWTEYSFDLPEGVQYFAIVSNSYNKFMLGIDNIAYKYVSPFVSLEVAGYNVYRNGELLTPQPIKTLQFEDIPEEDGTYHYCVSVVYNNGVSAPSNIYEAIVEHSSVKTPVIGTPIVRVDGNKIIVEGAKQSTVSTTDGKVVYSGVAPVRIDVSPGIYIVTADNLITKVIVK